MAFEAMACATPEAGRPASGATAAPPGSGGLNQHGWTDDVESLARLDLHSLRQIWRQRIGPPPKLRSVELLRLHLAWRLQAEREPGLVAALKRKLSGADATRASLPTGTRLTREWGDRTHEVTVVGDRFRYDNRDWGSLSEIARAITGVRWNGPRFFGLRREE